MSKRILYIGNQLSKHGFNKTTIETLGSSFENEGYVVSYSSSKKNQIVRLFDMIFTTFWNAKKVDFILIDTYSTSSFWYAFFCSQIARVFKTKYIPILHGGDLPKRLDANPKLSRMLFNNAFKNVAPSGYLLSEFANKGYQNVVYIPNSIEIKKYPFKVRKLFEPKLLWVRAFATIYNPKMAVDVLKELQVHFPKASLTMVGPDKDGSMENTKQYANKLGVEVCFTNRLTKEEWIDKIPAVIQKSDKTARPQLVIEDKHPVFYNLLKEYYNKTAILKNYYTVQNKYFGVNGVGSIKEITIRLSEVLDKL